MHQDSLCSELIRGFVHGRRDRVGAKHPTGKVKLMRLEGWHAMVFLATLLVAALVVVAVTLIVLWTVRWAKRRNNGDGSGSSLP